MYRYVAFGLGIDSELPLPQLRSWAEEASVSIRVGSVPRDPENESTYAVSGRISIRGEDVQISFDREATYLVRGGREVIVDPSPAVERGQIEMRLTGLVMALLLHQRRSLVLHGNAVADGDDVLAVLGAKGAGKSTLTALLLQHGYAFVTDDVLAVDVSPAAQPSVRSGVPHMKLWPDTLEQLGWPLDGAPRFWPAWDKRRWSVSPVPPNQRLTLRRIYVVEESESIDLAPVTGKAALVAVARHLYHGRVATPLDPAASHFTSCVQLVRQVRVCRLGRPKDFAILPAVLGRLADDWRSRREQS